MTPEHKNDAAKRANFNNMIRILRDRQEREKDPVKYARIGEAIWTLQDLRDEKI